MLTVCKRLGAHFLPRRQARDHFDLVLVVKGQLQAGPHAGFQDAAARQGRRFFPLAHDGLHAAGAVDELG